MSGLNCFKAYDIRGRIPDELNETIVQRIGRAYAEYLSPKQVVVGYDIRLQSPTYAAALVYGLKEGGVDVIDIGLCGTEEVYFQTFHRGVDGGLMVTASHNPLDYNGLKLVRTGARPISGDTGLKTIQSLAEASHFKSTAPAGQVRSDHDKTAYIQHLLSYIDRHKLKPLKIVVNAGNGGAGIIIDALEPHLPFEFIKINHSPDGSFPNGIPNPLLPENRAATVDAVKQHSADLGLAWDGDFDRCFFFDETGRFIEGYYIVGLLAEQILKKHPGAKIIHDPRLTWNTIERVNAAGGIPIQSKTGHAFIKERMRVEDAIYGGEMSAHHYFRDFAYCDSGMIPWLLVVAKLCQTGQSLSALVDERMRSYPCSGEINYTVKDSAAAIERILAHYAPSKPLIDRTDGISLEFSDWRFNLRTSNTEPLLRLNVETRHNPLAVKSHVTELAALIDGL